MRGFMALEPHEKMMYGLLLIAIGFGICGRFLVIFKTDIFSGFPQVDKMLNAIFTIPIGSFVLNIADIIEFIGLALFLQGVREM